MSTTVEEEIKGVVELLHYAKPGFSAGKLYCGGRRTSFSVKGFVKQGQPVTLRGQWETHPKFGRQFKGSEVVYTMPADAEGIEAWLRTYAEGMGPVKAKLAVTEFGIDFPRVLANDPEQVAIALRLPIEFVDRIAAKWLASAGEVNAMATLLRHGLSQIEAETLYEKYKGSAVTILEENPYQLLGQVPGFGWAKIDAIGGKFGIEPHDPRRLRASLVEVLRIEHGKGSTCVGEGLIDSAADLCGAMFIESGALEIELTEAIREKRIVDLDGAHGLPRPVAVEQRLAELFADFGRKNGYFRAPTDAEVERFRELPTSAGIVTLDDTQVAAVRCAIEHRGSAITGGAGVGKTLIARAIVRQYEAADLEIALCAPTGKAAKHLGTVLGREGSTIHRLLGYDPATGGFLYDHRNLLPHDLILIDEVSMCDAELLYAVLQAARPGAAVVLIGDPNQLPPVGAGYPLRDILAYDLMPSVRLGHCHRQAGVLKHNCNRVLDGVLEPTDTEGDPPAWIMKDSFHEPGLTLAAIQFLVAGKDSPAKLDEWGYGDLFAHQFMTAKHDGQLGTKTINELLQRLHQKKRGVDLPLRDATERLPLLLGDKVIQTANNYQLGVMNGTLGVVTDDEPLTVQFDGGPTVVYTKNAAGQLSLAYCLTPHKCVHPDTLVETSEGLLPIRMVADSGNTATPAGKTKYTRRVINAVAPAVCIKTAAGYELTTTPDHGVERWTGESYTRCEASELKIGDWVRLKMGAGIEPKKLATLPTAPEHDVRAVEYKLPEFVDEEVAEFLGLMVGDGTVYKGGFRLLKRHREVGERFKFLCERLFGAQPKYLTLHNAHGYEVRSTFLASWLSSIGGLCPNLKSVPECILRSSSSIHGKFLRGLFEDGTVNLKKGVCDHIELSSGAAGLLSTVQTMLLRLGMYSTRSQKSYSAKKDGRLLTYDVLYLYGEAAKVFKDRVGFISEFKQSRLGNFARSARFMLPISKAQVDALTVDRDNARPRRTVSRSTAALMGWESELEWFHTRIVSLSPTECPSMCFEVPEGNRFLQNGFPFWNCQGSQVPCAIVICPRQHGFMQNRSWLYTALTRAQKTAIIMGDSSGCASAVKNREVDKRTTVLQHLSEKAK